jgi:hypothetical protein
MLRTWLSALILAFPLAAQPIIADCPVFPRNNIWNTPIDKMPVHPLSSTWIATEGVDATLHPDFGKGAAVPYNIVPADHPKVAIKFTDGAPESDPGPYPIPANPKLEPARDAHLLVVQQGECKLYEIYNALPQPDGTWTGSSGAIFDLRLNTLRPDGWTSADAAGLPILPGLVRYEEAASGAIRHAIRLTVPRTRRGFYLWPARHYAARRGQEAEQFVPMGARFRLKPTTISPTSIPWYGRFCRLSKPTASSWPTTGAPGILREFPIRVGTMRSRRS